MASPLELAERMLIAWHDRLAQHTLDLSSSRWPFWVVLGLGLGGTYVVLQKGWVRFGAVVLWGLAHILVYMALFPATGHGGRYQPLTPALFMGLAWIGAYCLAVAATSRTQSNLSRPFVVAGCTLLLALFTTRSLESWSRAHRDAVRHIWDTEVKMGRLVAELERSAVVASFDIGGIGFFAGREIVDLGGLVDSSVADALRESDAWSIVDARGVSHVVVPEGYVHDFPDPWNFYYRLGFHKRGGLSEIARLESPIDTWIRGLEASLHAAPAQVLYRVEASR